MSDQKPTTKRATPDWEKVEAEYRAGILSLREIAKRYGDGISHVAVAKRAKDRGWTRDLSGRIKAKADDLVNRAEVTSPVTKATEEATVNANAQAVASIRLGHRKDIARVRALCLRLTGELEAVTGEHLAIEQMRKLLVKQEGISEAHATKLRETLAKVMSLPSRASTLKQLSDALKTLVGLEREAWQIDEKGVGSTYDDFLDEIHGEDGKP